MIRGVHRQIIELNQTESPCFERALLFVAPACAAYSDDRLRQEAVRFVGRLGNPPRPRHGRPVSRAERRRRQRIRRTLFALWWTGLGLAVGLGLGLWLA